MPRFGVWVLSTLLVLGAAVLPTLLPATTATAAAATTSPAARRAIARARKLLRRAKDRRALRVLRRVLRRQLSRRDRAHVQLLIGIAHFNLFQRKRARRALRRALRLQRDISLPEDVSPKIAAMLRKLRRGLPPAKRRVAPGQHRGGDATPDGRRGRQGSGDAGAPGGWAPSVDPPRRRAGDASDRDTGQRDDTGARDAARGARDDRGKPGGALRTTAWVLAGSALAAAGAAVVLGVLSRDRVDEANTPSTPHPLAVDLHDEAGSLAVGANVSWGIAAAAAVGSAICFYLGYRKRARRGGLSDATVSVRPLLGATGAMLSIGGSL